MLEFKILNNSGEPQKAYLKVILFLLISHQVFTASQPFPGRKKKHRMQN
jgi:hypothetical protein